MDAVREIWNSIFYLCISEIELEVFDFLNDIAGKIKKFPKFAATTPIKSKLTNVIYTPEK